MSDLDFTGKVVLVTGSSRGIGAEIIKAFGKRGARCVVNYIADPDGQNKAGAESVAKDLEDPLVIECDVTKPDQVESMMMEIGDKRGGLDILVNNSGIIRDRTIKKMSIEEFESVVRVNLTGTFTVTQKAAAVLRGAAGAGQGSLLIEIPEDRIGVTPGCRYANLSVISGGTADAELAVPTTGSGVHYGAWRIQVGLLRRPAVNFLARGRIGDVSGF